MTLLEALKKGQYFAFLSILINGGVISSTGAVKSQVDNLGEDRHDENGGSGTGGGNIHFSTTDSTNFNEHILEVTSGTVDLTVGINSVSAKRNIFVEDLESANPSGVMISGVGLPVGIYRFYGNYTTIEVKQNGATASASDMDSYVK